MVGFLLLIFASMAFAIDLGFMFHARRVMQNAADPAALAGAAYLPRCPLAGQGEPIAAAKLYGEQNLQGKAFVAGPDDFPTPEIGSFTVSNDLGTATWPTVYAKVRRPQSFLFGRILGLTSAFVPAEAEAACGPISEGNVCPMYVAGNPNAGVQRDANGNITSAYGLTIGAVYSMKDSAGHIGALSAPIGPGTSQWTDFIRQGCEDPSGAQLEVVEGGDVESKPGNWGNPTSTGLEGGQGSNSYGLYEPEITSGLFPKGHISCDFHLEVDPSDASIVQTDPTTGFQKVRKYGSNGAPIGNYLSPAQLVAEINKITDPDEMASTAAPCGALRQDGTPVPELITDAVQGRFMHIVLTDGFCTRRCDLPVLGIMRMYILCWTNQQIPSGSTPCVPNRNQPNQTTIYGVFADFTAPSLLGGGGLGTNPLAPFHVVLVK